MRKRFPAITTLLIFTVATLLGLLTHFLLFATPSKAADRLLVPTASSPTAMVKCGAMLEAVKANIGATRRYVFTGQETLSSMRYCIKESSTDVVDTRNEYRVPAGTIGWLAVNGQIVLEGCVNDATCKGCLPHVATAPPTPAPAPPVATTVVVKAPEKKFTNRVMVWEILGTQAEKDDFLKNELGVVDGKTIKEKQSRDLGNVIKKGLAEGRLAPWKTKPGEKILQFEPQFHVEFHDLDWNAAQGSKLGINNKYQFGPGQLDIPANFGPSNNAIVAAVINGELQITVEKKIVIPETSITIRAPALLPVVHPKDGALHTCIEHRTSGKCGGTEMSRYYRIVQSRDWTRFNFFVIVPEKEK